MATQDRMLTRRSFAKRSAFAALAASVAGSGLMNCLPKNALADAGAQDVSAAGYQYDAEQLEGQWIHSACSRNCFDTCMIKSKVVDGRLVAVTGDSDNPYTAGGLCVKTQNYVDYVYNEDRILYPLNLVG